MASCHCIQPFAHMWYITPHESRVLIALQGGEVQEEIELEDDEDYEENGRDADKDDLDGGLSLLNVFCWQENILPPDAGRALYKR